MKKVLITGKNSYIGAAVSRRLAEFPGEYEVERVSLRDGSWRRMSFAGYDSVVHAAGIAHSDTGKVSREQKAEYYRVNRDLTAEVARKAKAEGVSQFIFMSSAIVYGDSAPMGSSKHITRQTQPSPANFYGDTKWQAEMAIRPLETESFAVAVVRAPMVYGPGSRGNYPLLSRLARKMPCFPAVENRRSMLFIGNLTEFIRLLIDDGASGVFWPQNREYTCTAEMVRLIARAHGKTVRLLPGTEWFLKLLGRCTGLVSKAFGNLTYDQEISRYRTDYRRFTLEESIQITEGIGQ